MFASNESRHSLSRQGCHVKYNESELFSFLLFVGEEEKISFFSINFDKMAIEGDCIYEFFIKKSDQSVLLLSNWRTDQPNVNAKYVSLQSESTFNASTVTATRKQLTRFQIVPLNGRASFYIVDPNSSVDNLRYMVVDEISKKVGFTTIKPTDSNANETLYRFSFPLQGVTEQQVFYIQSDNFPSENLSFQTGDVNQNLPLVFSTDPSRAVPFFANQLSSTVPIKFDKDGAIVGKNVVWYKNYVLWVSIIAVVVVLLLLIVLFLVVRKNNKKPEADKEQRDGGSAFEKGSFVSSGQENLAVEVETSM